MENSREKFKKAFPDEHSLVVALHSKNLQHALEGAEIAIENGAHGVALVTHVISPEYGIATIQTIKEKYPYHQAILNVLQRDPYSFLDTSKQRDPKRVMESIQNTDIDGIRTDKAMIRGIDKIANQEEEFAKYADQTLEWQEKNGWNKLYFGGFDFKHQTPLSAKEYPYAIQQAQKYLDVITTSGLSTGISADTEKVKRIKELSGNHPIGLASGVTAENADKYIPNTDISIVATGISQDYRNLDPKKVAKLANIIEQYNRKIDRKKFEAQTLERYNTSSVPELYSLFKEGNIINIGMRPDRFEVEKKLSNLYPSAFILDEIKYASIEAFWMSIKYPPTDPRRIEIRQLSELKAKNAGREARGFKTIQYQDKNMCVGSLEHHALLKRALKAKLEQNPDILQALMDTGDKQLTHIVFTKDNLHILHDSKTIPGDVFAQLYTELRDEFRKK